MAEEEKHAICPKCGRKIASLFPKPNLIDNGFEAIASHCAAHHTSALPPRKEAMAMLKEAYREAGRDMKKEFEEAKLKSHARAVAHVRGDGDGDADK
jgi:hypothetical protein